MGVEEKALGKRLQLARQRAGLTQQELCQRAGLAYSTLTKIERGAIRSPSVFTVVAIARATKIPLDELLGKTADSPALSARKQQSKTGVRFVFFDINGVLVRFFQRAFVAIAKNTGNSIDVVENTFWRYNAQICRGKLTIEEFNSLMAHELDVTKFDWRSYYLKAVEPIPETQSLLQWAEKHYEVGLFSNSMSGLIDMMIDNKLVPDIAYVAVVDSSVIGVMKPEAKAFGEAEKMAGVNSGEILLIDDSRSSVSAAKKLGWQALRFDEFDPAKCVGKARGILEFND